MYWVKKTTTKTSEREALDAPPFGYGNMMIERFDTVFFVAMNMPAHYARDKNAGIRSFSLRIGCAGALCARKIRGGYNSKKDAREISEGKESRWTLC